MPRNRKRTTDKGKWSEKDLLLAAEDVNAGKSIRKTAKDHSIPFSTLQERLKLSMLSNPSMGRKPIFTPEQENGIVQHVKALAQVYYGLTPLQLRKAVHAYAEKLNIPHPFSKETKLAGKDWLEGFLKRNPTLSVRKPEPTSLNRLNGFNKAEVKLFSKI